MVRGSWVIRGASCTHVRSKCRRLQVIIQVIVGEPVSELTDGDSQGLRADGYRIPGLRVKSLH
jgi:hypothetical protein